MSEVRKIKKETKYRHFKGHDVYVLDFAKHSETEETMVVYKHLGTGELWVRPYDMFASEVDREKYPDVAQKYRFEEAGMYDYSQRRQASNSCEAMCTDCD